jgi:AcrR family transcriptional regulator
VNASESDTVLDAAASCYLKFGVAKTTAADIAQAVGISRATLYRRFGSHESIFLALLTRESKAMAADADIHLVGIEDPRQRMLEGMLFSVAEIGRRPVHAAVFGGDSAAWAATQAIRTEALRRISAEGTRSLLEASIADGSVSDEDMADLVDWVLRILISYAAVPGPGGRSAADMRRQLSAWFLPAFENLLTGIEQGGVRH